MPIFSKKTWKNRMSEFPNRRRLSKENGTSELVTVSREEGLISQEGDAFSEENMNDLEGRIDAAFNDMSAVRVTLSASGWSTDTLPSQTVNVSWMTEDWIPDIPIIIPSDDVEECKALQRAYGCFEDEAKWLARYYDGYKEMPFGTVPDVRYKPAPNIDGWQFTSSGIVPGINGRVDLNIFWGEIVVPDIAPEYYKTPEFTLIEHLNKIGVDSSFKFRAKIAAENGIEGYVGSAEQNIRMLELLKEGRLEKA